MKSRGLLLGMILSLVPCGNLSAQERTMAAEGSVGSMQVDLKGNGAKFNEYRDLRNGVFGNIGLYDDGEGTYLDFRADDMGHKDQKYELDGGRWGRFKYHLGYEEIPHNFSFGHGPSERGKTSGR